MKLPTSKSIARSNLLLAQWSRSVGELVAACDGQGFEEALCRALRRLVEFDFVMVFGYRGGERPVALGDTLTPELRRILIEDYLNGPFVLDPFFQAILDGVRGGCYRLRDIAPDRFRQSEYFRSHYRLTGIREEVGFYFPVENVPGENIPGGPMTGVLSLARWTESPALGRSDMDLLLALAPAIAGLCTRHYGEVLQAHPGHLPGAPRPRDAAQVQAAYQEFGAGYLSERERQIVGARIRPAHAELHRRLRAHQALLQRVANHAGVVQVSPVVCGGRGVHVRVDVK